MTSDFAAIPQPDFTAFQTFLSRLHGKCPPDHFWYLWELDNGKVSTWWTREDLQIGTVHRSFENPGNAKRWTNLYTGVAWSRQSYGVHRRLSSEHAAGIPALWLDIDIAGPAHAGKQHLPPDWPTVLTVLDGWWLPPSAVVDSGHGVHLWWRLDQPWLFSDETARAQAAEFVRCWQAAFRARFAEHGWDLDSTHDLARVLRVPGTINQKPSCEPVLVTARMHGAQYSVTQCQAWIAAHHAPEQSERITAVSVDDVVVRPASEIALPTLKLDALQEASPEFKAAWARKAKRGQDTSSSGWDFTLAREAALAGWKPQQIVDLLVVYRTKYGEKDERDGYYKLTVSKAASVLKGNDAQAAIAHLAEFVKENTLTDDLCEAARTAIQERLGVRIDRIQKFPELPVQYVFWIGGVKTSPLTAAGVRSYHMVAEAILDAANIAAPPLKDHQWQPILQLLLKLMELEPSDPDASEEKQMGNWVMAFVSHQVHTDSLERAVLETGVWKNPEDGRTYLASMSFRQWIALNHMREIKLKEITRGLLAAGCTNVIVNLTINDTHTTRSFWKLPESLVSSNGIAHGAIEL